MLSRIEKNLCLLCIALSTACLVILTIASCQAQSLYQVTPDCCLQASKLGRENAALIDRLQRTQVTLDSTRILGDRIIRQTDDRLVDIAEINTARVKMLTAKIGDLQASQIDYNQVRQERDRLKGRTWAGRQLRKARDVLAYAGGLFLVVSTAKLLL